MNKEEHKTGIPNWLKNLQENSWELELLISGGAIFSLFQLSDYFIEWIQGIRITAHFPGAGIVLMVGMFGIKVLTLGFILHLIFRAYWLALVCINYVFPEGIDQSRLKLQKPFKVVPTEGKDLKEQIIAMDKNCGLVMYMSIISAITIFGLIALTLVLVMISIFLEESFSYQLIPFSGIFIFLLVTYIFDLISFGMLRKIPFLSYLLYPIFKPFDLLSLRFFYKRSLLLFSSNIKKWKFITIALIFACFAFLDAFSALYKVQHWPNILDDRQYRWQRVKDYDETVFYTGVSDLHYMENWLDDRSRPFGLGSKVLDGNLIEVYVRYDKTYDILIDATSEEPGQRNFAEVIQILLDGERVDVNWHAANKRNGDIGITAMIDLSSLNDGEHAVTITVKEKYRSIFDEFVNRPNLVEIPFWIDRPALPDLSLLKADKSE